MNKIVFNNSKIKSAIFCKNFSFIFLFICTTTFSQNKNFNSQNIGQPFIKYYGPKEYKSSYQNWCILQDKKGIMYFGNDSGILEYDGKFWRIIKTNNNSIVRSMCMDDDGKIYVAASSDFGCLEPDSKGKLQYVSILKKFPMQNNNFGDVWDVSQNSNGVYFKTQDKIFHLYHNKLTIIDSVFAHRLYKINDNIYVRNNGVGLCKIIGDSIVFISDGEKFASIGVYDMLPFGNEILVTTNSDGLFLYNGLRFSKFKTDADSFLMENKIYNACELNNGDFAFATQRGGVAIINFEGNLSQIINSKNGLESDVVYDVYQDRQNGLWLATTEGIERVEISSPFTFIPKEKTGNNYLSSLYRFHDQLYGANSFGILKYDKYKSEFDLIPEIEDNGQNIISINNSLYAATLGMIYKINSNNKVKQLLSVSIPNLYRSKVDTNIIYVPYRSGIKILKYENGQLIFTKELPKINDEIDNLVEDNDGSLWIKTYYEGAIHISCSNGNLYSDCDSEKTSLEYYYNKNEIPGILSSIFQINSRAYFSTDKGLFKFNPINKNFIEDTILGKSFTELSKSVILCSKSKKGDLWIFAKTKNGNEIGLAKKQYNGIYKWNNFQQLRRLDLTNVFTIYADFDPKIKKEFLWISSDEGLIRFDPSKNFKDNNKFSTFIREVKIGKDSLVYGGTKNLSKIESNIFPFSYNRIAFQFSAISYDNSNSNKFQYWLEGNDKGWSEWNQETLKEFTNLSSGQYTFHIRSKNIYGEIGNEDAYNFVILSPWYNSWWAYILYSIIFFGILYLIRDYELKRIRNKHSLDLELVAFEKLKELDQLKSHFFANISHEFRTPLTLVLGQIESVLSSNINIKEKGKLHIAKRNASRLLSLINQLLDLSKLESGSMKLKGEQHNIVSFLKSLFYSFESLAEAEKITLKFHSEFENIPVIFEPDKMEKIFYNLISNSLKFTKKGGEVKISLKVLNNSVVEIKVKDNGKGISKKHLPHIFDRFYQVEEPNTKEYEGTGIGLALAKELIELHRGKIIVESEENYWTEFTVELPLGSYDKEIKLLDDSITVVNENIRIENLSIQEVEKDKTKQNQNCKVSEIILIVEDNYDVRSYIKEQFENEFNILEAENGEVGIKIAQSEIPDLIISDVMMPKMDGFQFCNKIRNDEKTSHIPIIMLTAKAALDDKIEGLETGVDAYLTKPFSAKELKVRVKNLIYQRKQLRNKFQKKTVIKPSEVSNKSVDQKFLECIIKIIEINFENENFSIENIASEVNMSISQLNRKLNALIDLPAGQLIRSLRLQRAADLLKQNVGNVAEICYMVGFNDQAYFSRTFKKQFGKSPSEFKNSLK